MAVTLPEADFAPAVVWCCRCRGTKPLTQRNCTNQIHKTEDVEYEEGGKTLYKKVELPETATCGARTCETCLFVDGSDEEVRHPSQIPTKGTCGIFTEDMLDLGWQPRGRHILDILRGRIWCDCMTKREVVVYGKKGQRSKRQVAMQPTLDAVYDQFGKLMDVPPQQFNLKTELDEAIAFLWGLRASYWMSEIEKPGTLLEPEKPPGPSVAEVLGLTPLEETGENHRRAERVAATAAKAAAEPDRPKSTIARVLKKGLRKVKPKPQVALTPEQKAAKEAEEEAAFQRLLEKGNQELAEKAAEVADRKAKHIAAKAKQTPDATDENDKAPAVVENGESAADTVEAEIEQAAQEKENDPPKRVRKTKRNPPPQLTPEELAAKEAEEEAAFQRMLEKGNKELAEEAAKAAERKAKAMAIAAAKKTVETDTQT